ncbi:hypothetical protein [Mitsuokella multacida]|uniref:hypothetical protein n=1 Tax=Mitsuokella multacida TaxID=52226 RepID=UPI003D01CC2C
MSTYFETIDNDNGIQLSDNSPIYQVVRTGELSANYRNGEWYGFSLSNAESFATFKVDSGNLLISPMYIYNNRKIQYVSSDGSSIKYKVFGDSRSVTPSTHLTGIEVYNDNREVVYSSALDTLNYKLYKSILPYSSIYNGTGRDSDFMKIWNNMMVNGKILWDLYAYSGKDPYIMSYTIPWVVGYFTTEKKYGFVYGRKEYGIHFATGYKFSSPDSFSTHSQTFLITNMSTLKGDGDLHQLGIITKSGGSSHDSEGHHWNYAGIFCISYMFHIFDSR